MKRVEIVHYTGATAKSHSVVASLALDHIEAGNSVSVIDLAKTTHIHQGFPPRIVAQLLGHQIRQPALADIVLSRGGTYETLAIPSAQEPPRSEHIAALEQAVESELLTYFRLDHIPRNRESSRLRTSLTQKMHQTYLALDARWAYSRPDTVLIPNGRTSRQKAARLVAEHHGIDVLLYENGRATPDSYYLGTTQPHDRVASQEELLGGFPMPQDQALEAQAASWLAERMGSDSKTNPFSAVWEGATKKKKESSQPRAVFFASSFDEFLAFGPMWALDDWSHQFEAFDLIMSHWERQGVAIALRLHPNLVAKSRAYFRREVDQVLALKKAHPSLTIHWHNSSVNSYDLVKEATYVIVERSTIGLEASLMGKPVWVTQATQWDLVADIRQLLTPSDITPENLEPWPASPEGARRFVAYWMAQERPLRYSWANWSSWNPERAPTKMKLAQLALRNSPSHKFRLMRLEHARSRNSRFQPPAL